jgi:hypothetical protein
MAVKTDSLSILERVKLCLACKRAPALDLEAFAGRRYFVNGCYFQQSGV